jgi:hypothetical protein
MNQFINLDNILEFENATGGIVGYAKLEKFPNSKQSL